MSSNYSKIVNNLTLVNKTLQEEGYSNSDIDVYLQILDAILENFRNGNPTVGEIKESFLIGLMTEKLNAVYFQHPLIGLKILSSRRIFFLFELVRRKFPLYREVYDQLDEQIQKQLFVLDKDLVIFNDFQDFWTYQALIWT